MQSEVDSNSSYYLFTWETIEEMKIVFYDF